MDEVKIMGAKLVEVIETLLKEQNMKRKDLGTKIRKTESATNKMLFSLRKEGSISLKSLMEIAYALDIEQLSEFIKVAESIELKPIVEDNEITDKMIKMIENSLEILPVGKEFEIKEILWSTWDELNHSEKQRIGRVFYKDVAEGKFNDVVYMGKRSNGHAFYKKGKKQRVEC